VTKAQLESWQLPGVGEMDVEFREVLINPGQHVHVARVRGWSQRGGTWIFGPSIARKNFRIREGARKAAVAGRLGSNTRHAMSKLS